MRPNLTPLLLATLVACASVESKDTLTDALYADLGVTADGGGTSRAYAILRVGGATSNTYVQLVEDDVLTVTSGEESETMMGANIGDYYTYSANLDADAEDDAFTFALTRTVDDGAPDSTVTLPAPFDIVEPAADTVVSRAGGDLRVTWGLFGTDDAMSVEVSGDCIYDHYVTLDADTGEALIAAGTLTPVDEETPQSCAGTVTVTRRRAGTLDAGYGEGGVISAQQVRTVGIRLDP